MKENIVNAIYGKEKGKYSNRNGIFGEILMTFSRGRQKTVSEEAVRIS